MKTLSAQTLAALALTALVTAGGCAKPPELGGPLRGLTRAERDQFDRGRVVFAREFKPESGLGPLFNAVSCGECHEEPVPGGFGDEVEVHATARQEGRACDDLSRLGGPVFQQHVTPALHEALGIDAEPVPPEATGTARRTTPMIMGLGLLDVVPEAAILSRADPDDRDHDGISGRPNRFTDGRLGRFGRKAFVPTLREFNTGAFVIEMGVTSPESPHEESIGGTPLPPGVDPAADPEIGAEELAQADAFVRFLAPPSPGEPTRAIRRGKRIFHSLHCASCHLPELKTGKSPVEALSRKTVYAYTDLLLHDMGPDLADICLGLAEPSEFRTEPLMGLHLRATFLHDGRAGTIEDAIRLHGGEAAHARDQFGALEEADRRALLAFLGSL